MQQEAFLEPAPVQPPTPLSDPHSTPPPPTAQVLEGLVRSSISETALGTG